MRAFVLIALCILAGCGTAPPAPSPVAASAAPAAATSEAVPKKAVAADEKTQFKPPAGYKTKIVGWDIVYCRKTVVLGSRFPKEVCMTEAELKDHLASNDEMRRNKDEVSRVCTSAAGCASN